MKIYLSGPIRGIPDWNRAAFDRSAKLLREAGHVVYNPAEIGRSLGYSPETTDGEGRDHLQHVILGDVSCIFAADTIALLPGWENSRGATVELALAQFLGLKVICAVTGMELNIPLTPWSLYFDRFGPKPKFGQMPTITPPGKCEACCGTGYHRYPDFADGTPNYSDSAACGACKGKGVPELF